MRALKIMLRAWFCLAIALYRLDVQLQDESDETFYYYFFPKTLGVLFLNEFLLIHMYRYYIC